MLVLSPPVDGMEDSERVGEDPEEEGNESRNTDAGEAETAAAAIIVGSSSANMLMLFDLEWRTVFPFGCLTHSRARVRSKEKKQKKAIWFTERRRRILPEAGREEKDLA